MAAPVATVLQPGEFLDPQTNGIWGPVLPTFTQPCDDPGCYVSAQFVLLRTIHGTCLPQFRCGWHAPQFVVGTGQALTVLPFDSADLEITHVAKKADNYECDLCYGTGFHKGFGAPCRNGCGAKP